MPDALNNEQQPERSSDYEQSLTGSERVAARVRAKFTDTPVDYWAMLGPKAKDQWIHAVEFGMEVH